jgi:photoactive yellow protein
VIDLVPPSSSAATLLPFDPFTVDERSEAELDELPFGIICLDEEGTILRYNLAEARLARLDRNQVVGKNFFARVAPCTAGPGFEGRFREFARASGGQDVLRFDYLFDFKFGAQEVGIEIVRAPSGDRFYLFVNRRKFFEARRDLPEGFAAPLQRELAPNEQAEGVRRDDVDRRVLEVPWSFLSALRTTCDQVAPEGWPLFCTAWGTQWGRSVAVDLETEALEAFQLSIREVPLRTAMEMLSRGMARQGWGALRIDFSYTPQSAFVAHLDRSAVAEAAARSKTMRCHMVSGMLGAVFTHIASRRVVAREVTCKARGDASCTFVVVPDSRRSALESAIQAGLTDVGTVVRSLKRESLRG